MSPVAVVEGDGPLILAAPHAGTEVPEALTARLNARGRALADTDWWIDRLYEGLKKPRMSRFGETDDRSDELI